MLQPAWSYSARRDDTVWKLLAAGAAGAIPAAILLPLTWRVATEAGEFSGEGLVTAALFLTPAVLLSAWAAVWWGVAARRVVRLRRLVRRGVRVPAVVRSVRLLRDQHSAAVGAVVRLDYDLAGRVYQLKKRTTAGAFPWGVREGGRLDVVVDPDAPSVAALVLDERLY